jgi:adenosine deaminase
MLMPAMQRKPTADLIQALPKVELHVHLEGAVNPAFWKSLLDKHNPTESAHSIAVLEKRFQYTSFIQFLDVYRDIVFSFKTPDDFYELTLHYLNDAVRQNIRYCEVMITPWFVVKRGIDYQEMMAEIDRAAKEVESAHDIEMKLILDGPRNFGKDVVKEVFDMAIQDRTGRVIAVGLGGDEKNFPAQDFAAEFEYARANGFHAIAHAGETAGEQSMLDAIKLLKARRLGHCLGIPKESKLEKLIEKEDITLDLCPWSNVRTKVINEIDDHPMFDYLSRGYPITLNSDDPGMFGNSLLIEYETMVDLHGATIVQLSDLAKNAVKGSFMSPEKKLVLEREIETVCNL